MDTHRTEDTKKRGSIVPFPGLLGAEEGVESFPGQYEAGEDRTLFRTARRIK